MSQQSCSETWRLMQTFMPLLLCLAACSVGDARQANETSLRWAMWEASFADNGRARSAAIKLPQDDSYFEAMGVNNADTNGPIELIYPPPEHVRRPSGRRRWARIMCVSMPTGLCAWAGL
jgi:hypothetical protein